MITLFQNSVTKHEVAQWRSGSNAAREDKEDVSERGQVGERITIHHQEVRTESGSQVTVRSAYIAEESPDAGGQAVDQVQGGPEVEQRDPRHMHECRAQRGTADFRRCDPHGDEHQCDRGGQWDQFDEHAPWLAWSECGAEEDEQQRAQPPTPA